MGEARREKQAQPARLRTRLALAFGCFALIVVTGLALLQVWYWQSTQAEAASSVLTPILVTAGALVVAVSALGGYLLAGPLARPMERWAEAADRIGLGERDVTFPQVGGSHELARVSAALQSMFARLTEKEDQLQERIRERTEALLAATRALEAERAQLHHALEGSRLAYWEFDLQAAEIRLSAEWSRMLGSEAGEVVTTVEDLLALVPEEERARLAGTVIALAKGEESHYDLDHRVRRHDGSLMWIRSRGRITARSPEGRALRMAGTNVDIAPRKAQEEERRAVEARLKLVMDSLDSSICHVDLTGRILFANRGCHEFFGRPEGSIAGTSLGELAGDEATNAFGRGLPQLLAGNEVRFERKGRLHGRQMHFEVRLVPHRDELGITESLYALITDMSERREAERILERQALTDPTTSLPNRRLFIDRLDRALAQAHRQSAHTAVLCAGLDGFRAVNEAHGREAGDALLRLIGARCAATVRGADTVARLDNDEFGILLENCRSVDDAELVARKLVEALASAFSLPTASVELSCSVGIALAPADGEEPEVLLRNAAQALLRARRSGQSRLARHHA